MSLNRIYVSEEVDLRLRTLRARTGLTPNLLCRFGICLSLSEPGVPDPSLYEGGHTREFNRYTLTGQWDLLFFSLRRGRLVQDSLDPVADIEKQFKAHLNLGVQLLYQRVKRLEDVASLVSEAQRRAELGSSEGMDARG